VKEDYISMETRFFRCVKQNMAMYTTLKYMLAHILLTRITTLHLMLSTGSASKSRTRGIICIWVNGFLAQNSSTIWRHTRQQLRAWEGENSLPKT
jgi:hypothetical protein